MVTVAEPLSAKLGVCWCGSTDQQEDGDDARQRTSEVGFAVAYGYDMPTFEFTIEQR